MLKAANDNHTAVKLGFEASFPGAGTVLGPRLRPPSAVSGNAFKRPVKVQQLSGPAPIPRKSGHSLVLGRWPKFYLQTFHEFAAQSRLQCSWANAYYQQLQAWGNQHHAAIRVLAFRWIRTQFRCWQERTPYGERRFPAARDRRQQARLQKLLPTALGVDQSPRPGFRSAVNILASLTEAMELGDAVENLSRSGEKLT